MSEDVNKQDVKTDAETAIEPVVKDPEPGPQEQESAKPAASVSIAYKFLLLLATAFSLVALAGSYYVWMQLQKSGEDVVAKIDSQIKQQAALISQAQQDQFLQVNNAVEQNKADSQRLLQLLQSMQQELQEQARHDVKLVQAESVLRLAKSQYEILHDRETTTMALKLASGLLKEFSQPQIGVIRNLVLTELQAVENIKAPNLGAELIKLEALINSSQQLPLTVATADDTVQSETPEKKDTTKKTWRESIKGMLESLKPLITVRRQQGATVAMLSIEEEKLVRAILKSRYEYIRQSILLEDTALLKTSVGAASQWLKRYFDVEKEAVSHTLKQLDQLADLKMQPDYPPVGYALEQLVKFRQQDKPQVTP